MLLREFNDFCMRSFCVSALWQKLGEKDISAAPVYTGEKPTVETVRGEIANLLSNVVKWGAFLFVKD